MDIKGNDKEIPLTALSILVYRDDEVRESKDFSWKRPEFFEV